MSAIMYYTLKEGEELPDEFCAVKCVNGEPEEYTFYSPASEPTDQLTCTMEPDGWHGEEYGIYQCSACGELWQFSYGGPRDHGWTCCPKCRSIIDYGEVDA